LSSHSEHPQHQNPPTNDALNRTTSHTIAILGLWLVGALLATFLSAMHADSMIVNELLIPRTNDSFYHARRILDAVLGDGTLAQFDLRLNPPEGTVIPWPWGYDFMMVKLTQLALWISPGTEPMAFMAYVPVAWIAINSALFLGAAGAAGLSLPMRALAMLAFCLSPLTQLLHSVAMIDHHFVEFSFVLGITWLGIAWFDKPRSLARAAGLGLLLGAAPAFHVGLFILQLIPLGTVLTLWLRGHTLPRPSLAAFGTSLVATSILIVLPSLPFQSGIFNYGLLSWFHLYVACCTTVVAVLTSFLNFTRRSMAVICVVSIVLAIPLLANALNGMAFVSGNVSILPEVSEARSPFRSSAEDDLASSITYYSWLLLAAPIVGAWFGYRTLVEKRPERLYFAFAGVLGLALLMLQFRFHYYGSFALIAGTLLIVETLRRSNGWHRGTVFVASFALLALAYQPPLRERLFVVYALASSPKYQQSLPIYLKLAEVCAEDPGLVLADQNDGNAILFHSDCSVIANNFILGPEDDAKFARITRLMRSPTEELLHSNESIKYLFVRTTDFGHRVDDRLVLDPGNAIVTDLILNENLPEGFDLLQSVDTQDSPDTDPEPHARLYKLTSDE
jgi:hypothetical protein